MTKTQAVRRLAPEDIQIGDFVALLSVTCQLPTYLWCFGPEPHEEPVRIKFLPYEAIGAPLKVKAVCLPFVMVGTVDKQSQTLDIRQCELARLDSEFAKVARGEARKMRRKSRRKKK